MLCDDFNMLTTTIRYAEISIGIDVYVHLQMFGRPGHPKKAIRMKLFSNLSGCRSREKTSLQFICAAWPCKTFGEKNVEKPTCHFCAGSKLEL